MATSIQNEKKLRTFSPVILFHDHEYIKSESGDLEHIHIPYGDPTYESQVDSHKKRINEMLQTNGKYWLDIINYSRDHPELDHSPVPSLISSPSPPHYYQNQIYYNQSKKDKKQTSLTNKRRRGNLPKAVTAILRDWLSQHKKHPYPTEEEKASLAALTNLNLNQISNWFINARRRILQPMLEQEQHDDNNQIKNELDIIMPYNSQLDTSDDHYSHKSQRKRSVTDSFSSPQKRLNTRRKS